MVEEGAMSLTFDELSMQQTLLFSDTLKDLRTLRSQLYSAAEYFELAYTKNDQKQIVVNSLKDYTVKALVNTVDHLGSTSFKVSSLVDQKFNEVADTNLRLSCIEQRTGVCQAHMDREGLAQQSLVITAPKYHKRYVLPVGESIPDAVRHAVPNYRDRETTRIKNKSAEMHQLQNAVRQKTKEKQHPSFRLA